MNIRVDPDWWKEIFDEVYLLTDARSVCDEEITRLEVDIIEELLQIRPGQRILDLCGGHGRHSLELCARGFNGCTLLDYSHCLLEIAKARAAEFGYSMEFTRGDARETGLPAATFDHVLIMGNSLGYAAEPEADARILAEANRVLRPGGTILVDVANGRAVKESFTSSAWHEIGDDIIVCRERELQHDRVLAREVVVSKKRGLVRDCTYAMRLYFPESLEALLREAAFESIIVRTRFAPHRRKGDYGFMNKRMLATGCKR
ncbi:MAG: methyltransferase domain-containing protein [Deltaproteobacteria bacterium]|nr:methyltransferase domain-containing protein [Deltaproteobacteria bacterium]MBW2071399.1 methyltransferase domain-containing protein [Deltaproteobacteria bacterium]